MLLHLPDHHKPGEHLLEGEPVEQLCGVPHWGVGHAAPLRLKVEHVVPVLDRLRSLAKVELVQLDGAPQGVLVVLVLLVHLPVIGPLTLGWRRVIAEEDSPLLLSRLDHVGLLPVLHYVREGQFQMLLRLKICRFVC